MCLPRRARGSELARAGDAAESQPALCGCHQYGVPLRWRYESRCGRAVRASRLGITFRMK
eukprot:177167-Pleurochrysis_carterae.AAC.1